MRRVVVSADAIVSPPDATRPHAPIVAVVWAWMPVAGGTIQKEAACLLTFDGALTNADATRRLDDVNTLASSSSGASVAWSFLEPPKLSVQPRSRAIDAGLHVPAAPLCYLPEYWPTFGGVCYRDPRGNVHGGMASAAKRHNASVRAMAACDTGEVVLSTHSDNFLYHRDGSGAPSETVLLDHSGRVLARFEQASQPLVTTGARGSSIHISPDGAWIAMTHEGAGSVPETYAAIWSREGQRLFTFAGRSALAAALPWSHDSRRVLLRTREEVRDRLTYRWKAIDVVTGETEVMEEFDGVGPGRERAIPVPVGFADGDRLFVERVSERRFDIGIWERGKKVKWIVGVDDSRGRSAQQVTPTRALLAWE